MKKSTIIILIISLLIIGGFIDYTRLIFKNGHYCKNGEQLNALKQNGALYLECGYREETSTHKEINENKIIDKVIVLKEGSSHIEEYKLNWADSEEARACWGIWLLGVIAMVFVCSGWFDE